MGEPVYLVGNAAEVGAVQGRLQREVLRERLARLLKHAEANGRIEELQHRAERLGEVLLAATPHWLEEARAGARIRPVEAALMQVETGVYSGTIVVSLGPGSGGGQ